MNDDIELTKEQKAQETGKNVADTAARMAATYYGGAVGNKLYNAASNSEFVQNRLNNIGNNLSKNPAFQNKHVQNAVSNVKPAVDNATNISSNSNSSLNSKPDVKDNSSKLNNGFSSLFGDNKSIKKKILIKILPPIAMFIILMFTFLIIVSVIMGGFEYINTSVNDTKEKIGNFFTGCGWSTEEECQAKQNNNFYKKIETVYDEYKSKYNIELDKNLLVATLTYNNPFITATETDDFGSTTVDYKKGKKHVEVLAKHMTDEITLCYIVKKDTGITEQIDCGRYDYYKDNKDLESISKVYKDTTVILDLEKYRNYLEGNGSETSFIVKYYLGNKNTEDNKAKAKTITEEIYQRVELYNYLTNSVTPSKSIAANNTTITITDCNGIAMQQVTLSEYLQGVVYMYYEDDIDYLKYVAVAAKNYLYSVNNVSIDNMSQSLRIKNCATQQLSCSVTEGCSYNDNTLNNSGEDLYKGPVTDTKMLSNIKQAVEDTISEFVLDNGIIVNPINWYINLNEVRQLLNSSDYKTVLVDKFGGSIESISLFAVGYPLDLKWINVTSGYGWRIHPISNECKFHNGTDIAAEAYSNIYSIADGVVTKSVTDFGKTGYGNYVEIGHGQFINGHYEYYSLYAHQVQSPLVSVGDIVKAGEVIGYVGSTGASTGNHLHIEVFTYVNDQKVRQDAVLSFKNIQLTGVTGPMYESESQCMANR